MPLNLTTALIALAVLVLVGIVVQGLWKARRIGARGRAGRQLAVDRRGLVAAHRGIAARAGLVADHHVETRGPRRDAPRLPQALRDDAHQHQHGERDQGGGQVQRHHASAMERAASMSTATMRDTPCSCIVTPISCSAISIAILLWEMNRNCVPLNDISLTSFA